MEPSSLAPFTSAASPLAKVEQQIRQVFVGQDAVVRHALVTLLSGGHLLIEDVPGVGKTTLALGLAKAVGCTFQRIQFTSDMLPSDILGVSILNPRTQEFEFRKGPLFHQVVLADELNRATPRTQSALLEAMNERQITVDNQTYVLPRPFFVVATQNPHEHHGTFPLPESQLDRFMTRLSIGYPDAAGELEILRHSGTEALRLLNGVLPEGELLARMDEVPAVQVAPPVDDYILALVQATRQTEHVEIGVSPRGAVSLRRAAQANALLSNRRFVTPDDVKAVAVAVLAHRLIWAEDQVSDIRSQSVQLIGRLLQTIPVPL